MTLSPLEINKLIAEAKGIKWQEKEVQGAEDAVFSTKNGYSFEIHNWASDIKDAWELFEEMPYEKIIIEDRYGGVYSEGKWLCGIIVNDIWPSEQLIGKYKNSDDDAPDGCDESAVRYWRKPNHEKCFVAANTAPLAICTAWLKWKEQTLKDNNK